MARIDHSACNHPKTPAGRRACRASGVPAPEIDYVARHINKVVTAHKIRAQMDREETAGARMRRMRREPYRNPKGYHNPLISPRCPQVALHASPGKCACGVVTPGCARCENHLYRDSITGPKPLRFLRSDVLPQRP